MATWTWLATSAERRASPLILWPEVRSIIMLGLNYGPDDDPLAILKAGDRAAISVYAKGDDYHELIKSQLKHVGALAYRQRRRGRQGIRRHRGRHGEAACGAAGLGWQGKHTNLVSRQFGSWLFLGSIFTTLDLPADHRRQLTAAAAAAHASIFARPRLFLRPTSSTRAAAFPISPSSIKGPIPRELRPAIGNRIYGCDDCLAVCPWNKFASARTRSQARGARHIAHAPPGRSCSSRRRAIPHILFQNRDQANRKGSICPKRVDRHR